MVPAGYAADFLRFCYSGFSYLPSVGRWVRIRWYRLPEDTPIAPGLNPYSSPVWDLSTDFWPGYGEWGAQRLTWQRCEPPPWDFTLWHGLRLSAEASMVHAQLGPGDIGLSLGVDSDMNSQKGIAGSANLSLESTSHIDHIGNVKGLPGLKLMLDGQGRHGSF